MVKEEVQKIIIKTAEPILAKKVASQFSINSALKKSDEKEEITVVADKKELPSNHFSEPDLHTEWNLFLKDLQKKDSIVFYAINLFKLHKKDENTIEITYPSDSAKSEFEKVRADFFNHFMHKVNHFNIVITYKHDISLKKEMLTKRKIFDKFVEINPVLKDLDDIFKLDFN